MKGEASGQSTEWAIKSEPRNIHLDLESEVDDAAREPSSARESVSDE